MEDSFLLPVTYQNKITEFVAQLFTSAYSYRIEVNVNDTIVNFERDDEGNFRAIAASPDDKTPFKTDLLLFQAIADSIEEILS